jgi:hypothetical protein
MTKRVLLGVPTYDVRLDHRFARSVAETTSDLFDRNVHVTTTTVTNSCIDFARNYISSQARIEGYDALLFFDSDEFWDARDGVAIVMAVLSNEADIAGATYAKKKIDFEHVRSMAITGASSDELAHSSPPVCQFLAGDLNESVYCGPVYQIYGRPFGRVKQIGAGFMCVSVALLCRLAELHGELRCGDGSVALFAPMIDERSFWLSEDNSFCHRARAANARFRLLLDADVAHVGTSVFRTRIKYMLEKSE